MSRNWFNTTIANYGLINYFYKTENSRNLVFYLRKESSKLTTQRLSVTFVISSKNGKAY